MSEPSARALAPGLTHAKSVTVPADLPPAHLRGDPIRVLATPEMICLVEQTAIECVAPHLAPGQTTVGTRVDIAPPPPTPGGRAGPGAGRAARGAPPAPRLPGGGARRAGRGGPRHPRALRRGRRPAPA